MKTPLSAALAEKLERAQLAYEALEERHVSWIIGAALGHFVREIETVEADVLRHERFRILPIANRFGGTDERDDEIARAFERRRAYALILDFLKALNEAHAHASAERFARDLIASGIFAPK